MPITTEHFAYDRLTRKQARRLGKKKRAVEMAMRCYPTRVIARAVGQKHRTVNEWLKEYEADMPPNVVKARRMLQSLATDARTFEAVRQVMTENRDWEVGDDDDGILTDPDFELTDYYSFIITDEPKPDPMEELNKILGDAKHSIMLEKILRTALIEIAERTVTARDDGRIDWRTADDICQNVFTSIDRYLELKRGKPKPDQTPETPDPDLPPAATALAA